MQIHCTMLSTLNWIVKVHNKLLEWGRRAQRRAGGGETMSCNEIPCWRMCVHGEETFC